MSTRDRLVLFGVGAVAVLAAVWMLAVSPARKQASTVSGEVAGARSQLAQAQSEAAQARTSQQRYRAAYASLTSLGMAVPTSQEVPSLIYTLDHAANHHQVQFNSITSAASSGGSAAPASSAAAPASSSSSAPGAPAAAGPPFTQVPFTLIFSGSYQDLIHLLTNLEAFTVQTHDGGLRVSGRLLTIQSIQLGGGSSGAAASGPANPSQMSWTITASAYVLAPASPTPAPSPGAPSGSGTPAAAPGASSAVGTPAVVRVGG